MTAALVEGKLEPSEEAKKLVESLAERLNRRDFETKHKATKHFFESLKTENEKLFIKKRIRPPRPLRKFAAARKRLDLQPRNLAARQSRIQNRL